MEPDGPYAELLRAFYDGVQHEIDRHDVDLRLYPKLDKLTGLREFPIPRMHQPLRQRVDTERLLLTAERGGEILGTYVAQCFYTGRRDLIDFLEQERWYVDDGRDSFVFTGEAEELARGVRGAVVYSGGVWVKKGHRKGDGASLGPWWREFSVLYGRALGLEIWAPDYWWALTNDSGVTQKIGPSYGLTRLVPAVRWLTDGEMINAEKHLGLIDVEAQLRAMSQRVAP